MLAPTRVLARSKQVSGLLPSLKCSAMAARKASTSALSKTAPISIVGAGAWGLSTALHLRNAGYSDITVFDRASKIPSAHSAAYDLNKIVRAEYEDPFYTELALEAINTWKTPLWAPYYHQTGYVVSCTSAAPQKAIDHLEAALSSVQANPAFSSGIERLSTPEDFKRHTWQYTGALPGWKGYFNKLAGYAHSSDALAGIWRHCASLGIKFVLGPKQGRVVGVSHNTEGSSTSVVTAAGVSYPSSLTIVAAGAHAASLVPAIADLSVSKCWSVAHVQLTEDECNYLRGIPTTNVRDLGFFFEPDPKTRLFKICPLGAGYVNTVDGVSTPLETEQDQDYDHVEFLSGDKVSFVDGEPSQKLPAHDTRKLRTLLQQTFPWMANRPFVHNKLCWFSDTKDSDYIIDYVPGTSRRVVVLSGDSGHGFKMMPIMGKWVVDLLERGDQVHGRWKWKGEVQGGADEVAGGKGGGGKEDWSESVSWRIGKGGEIREVLAGEAASADGVRAKL